jgi:hypothetical protein
VLPRLTYKIDQLHCEQDAIVDLDPHRDGYTFCDRGREGGREGGRELRTQILPGHVKSQETIVNRCGWRVKGLCAIVKFRSIHGTFVGVIHRVCFDT